MEKRCRDYVGVTCVDGGCPIALADEYAERDMDVVRDCEGCIYYKGCEDCALCGTEYCDKKGTNMKFKNFLEKATEGVQIIISIDVLGMEFSTKHYADYYKNRSEELTEIMEKEIKTISLYEGAVFLTFKE